MKTFEIYDKSIRFLSKTLDLRAENHKIIVSNIANIDTPDYKAFELHVEDELKKLLPKDTKKIEIVQTRPGHQSIRDQEPEKIRITQKDSNQFSLKGDGNTVDIDESMVNLSKNNIMYNAATQLISKKFQKLKLVIQGGDK